MELYAQVEKEAQSPCALLAVEWPERLSQRPRCLDGGTVPWQGEGAMP